MLRPTSATPETSAFNARYFHPDDDATDAELIARAQGRIREQRVRVMRILDDLRHGLAWPIKRRSNVPTHYAISARHALEKIHSGRNWLPIAWIAYRSAKADLRLLKRLLDDRAERKAA